jgi:hypothetical protein
MGVPVRWEWIVIVYAAYFAAIAWSRGYSPALKGVTVAALCGAVLLPFLPQPDRGWQAVVLHALPLILLLAGYRLSGLFFVAPMAAVEAHLLAVDRRVFAATRWAQLMGVEGQWARGALELAYLFVYAMVPLGATVLTLTGASAQVPVYWTVVLAACFTSYAVLPFVQTRPPRAIECRAAANPGAPGVECTGLRRLNLAILRSSSNQVNTIPRGHVAAALAVSLMVLSSDPAIGLLFLAVSVAIALATVVGRYHYTVDTVAGAAVALASWLWFGQ